MIATDVWITKKQNFRYVNIELNKKKKSSMCPICKKNTRNIQAHHIVPRRLHVAPPLHELRFRICSGCHKKMHPESELIMVIKKLINIIDDLTDGKSESIDTVKKFRELVYNNRPEKEYNDKPKPGELQYDHLEGIKKNVKQTKR